MISSPYYVNTPCNVYGESLVRSNNGVEYTIRSVHAAGVDIEQAGTDIAAARARVAELNKEHNVNLAYAAGI